MAATTSTTENVRIARRVPEDIATERRFDLVDEVYTEDAVEHSPVDERRGRASIREGLEEFVGGFSDFTATVDDVVAGDDTVAMRVTLSGTHDGDFMDIAPTGESFEVENMVFTRLEDGRIAERWILPDMLGMLRQLGVVESPMR
ncbi:ester cyclase [Halomarina rubra]|uniref:Ester cyclase n=1 Tax=Halomarina rubra TaxID=2071873 RepID=A0ABD6AXC8_9EURY|nr:ester cyclase [Halomarina rubra]